MSVGIQCGMCGHTNDFDLFDERMWKHYLEGHEEKKPVKVSFR